MRLHPESEDKPCASTEDLSGAVWTCLEPVGTGWNWYGWLSLIGSVWEGRELLWRRDGGTTAKKDHQTSLSLVLAHCLSQVFDSIWEELGLCGNVAK